MAFNCIFMNKHYKHLYNAAFLTEEEAIDFVQDFNNSNGAVHFFTVNEIDQDGVVIRSILDKATYIGTTSTI